jgi:predicted N-formylglutamate amidohydrolase
VKLLITCEHGGNRIPTRYRPLFRRHRQALESHRGFDVGALAYARDFAAAFDAELVYSTTSRLLVELNRSPHHRKLFSDVTRPLPPEERERILERDYRPYRTRVETTIAVAAEAGEHVLHISCHSFTPRLNGEERTADMGLLYDPARSPELRLCRAWQGALRQSAPGWRVRRNYPYRGSDDGLTTHLRKRFDERTYCGVEVEVNQKHPLGEASAWRAVRKLLVETLRATLAAARP